MKLRHLNLVAGIAGVALLATAGSALAAVTTSDTLNVMAGPSQSTKLIGTIAADQTVAVSGQSGDWCKISAPTAGWVACANLNGFTPARTDLAPAAPTGYNWNSDPNMGPNAMGSPHKVYTPGGGHGSFS